MDDQHDIEQQPEANGQEPATEQPKARSGYGRLRNRHRALIAENDELQADYFRLLDAQKVLRAECAQWKNMYMELMADLKPLIEAKSNG